MSVEADHVLGKRRPIQPVGLSRAFGDPHVAHFKQVPRDPYPVTVPQLTVCRLSAHLLLPHTLGPAQSRCPSVAQEAPTGVVCRVCEYTETRKTCQSAERIRRKTIAGVRNGARAGLGSGFRKGPNDGTGADRNPVCL